MNYPLPRGLVTYGSQSMELMTKREYMATQLAAAAMADGMPSQDAVVAGVVAADNMLEALTKQDPRK